MTVRPLMRHKVTELEELFAASQADTETLKALEGELRCRHVPRAMVLLKAVQAKLTRTSPSTAGSPKPAPLQESSLPRPQRRATFFPSAPTNSCPAAPPPKPSTLASDGEPMMTLEDAYKVLRAKEGTPWEVIEQTRRQLVQKAHPDNFGGLSADKRSAIQFEAKRANVAYSVLLQSRVR